MQSVDGVGCVLQCVPGAGELIDALQNRVSEIPYSSRTRCLRLPRSSSACPRGGASVCPRQSRDPRSRRCSSIQARSRSVRYCTGVTSIVTSTQSSSATFSVRRLHTSVDEPLVRDRPPCRDPLNPQFLARPWDAVGGEDAALIVSQLVCNRAPTLVAEHVTVHLHRVAHGPSPDACGPGVDELDRQVTPAAGITLRVVIDITGTISAQQADYVAAEWITHIRPPVVRFVEQYGFELFPRRAFGITVGIPTSRVSPAMASRR